MANSVHGPVGCMVQSIGHIWGHMCQGLSQSDENVYVTSRAESDVTVIGAKNIFIL